MNPDTTRLLLQKIDRLFSTMSLDSGHVNQIERDLMLSYIRELYAQFLDTPAASPPAASSQGLSQAPTSPEVIPTPASPPPTPEPQPEPHPISQPIISVFSPDPPLPPSRSTAPPPQPPAEEPETPSGPAARISKPAPSADPEVETLFEQEQARELADKLGSSPVDDLTTAFSINDRQIYINELFGRDQQVFTMTLQQLNSMDSFSEAREFLSRHIARKYRWTDKGKKNSAKAFIKTIRRKYP